MDNNGVSLLSTSNNVYNPIYVIPKWIYDALVRNNIVDVWSYSNVRSKLAINDIASFVGFKNVVKLDDTDIFQSVDINTFKFSDDDEKREFLNSVWPLSGTEEIANNVRTRLENYPPMEDSNLSYSFINFSDNIFAVLHEGFAVKIKDKTFKFNFIKDYLKEIYKHELISNVSRTDAFKLYLKYCEDTKDIIQIKKL